MVDWLEVCVTTSQMECTHIPIGQLKCFQCFIITTKRGPGIITKVVGVHSTLGAPAVIRACDQYLLRVVANERSQNGMAPAPDPVTTHHWDTSFAIRCNRGHNSSHAEVEDVAESTPPSCFVANSLKARGRNVANQHLGVA